MKNYYTLLLSLFILAMVSSCEKQNNEPYQALVFNSLMASSTSFQAGSSVGITADVSGTQVEYHWSYNSGSISGSGDYISYTNDLVGSHKVICSVVDSKGEVDQKEIWLTVQ
jgi:uncharacterized protein YcfL